MREFSPVVFLLLVVIVLGLGFLLLQTRKQAVPIPGDIASKPSESSAPTFSSYPVHNIYRGPIAPADFSGNQQAKEFRTRIMEAMKQGVNFAGHYVLAEWGCGTSCQNHALIDAISGKVIYFGLVSAYGVKSQPNSSLLIVNPANLVNIVESSISTDYYVLYDNQLQFLLKLYPGEHEPRLCIQIITKAKNFFTGEVKEFSDPCHVPYGWQIEK